MNSYTLRKMLSFQARVAQKVSHTSGSSSLRQLIVLCPSIIPNECFCSSIRNCMAYAKQTNIINKDSPIDSHYSKCSQENYIVDDGND